MQLHKKHRAARVVGFKHKLLQLPNLIILAGACLVFTNAISQDVSTIPQQSPFKINGTLSAGLQFFKAEGRPSNRAPFMWYIQGSPVVSLYGITLPFSFTVSEQQRDFRQPFNQFGVSPYYKWIKAHLGYRNVTFSPFTLGGHTIAGAGVELMPGKFRFGFMYGRLFKAVQVVGTTDGTFVSTPSFKRTAAAMKIGYGTEDNFIDLILLKGKDHENSLDSVPENLGITPAENLVAGIHTKQKFLKRFFFEGEYAQSLYTSNTSLTSPDTLSKGVLTQPFSFLVDKENISTHHSYAMEGSLGYQHDIYSLRVKYREVGPDYQSMGAYFFQNDIRNITVEPTVKLFKSALQINGSFGRQTDNLDKRRESTTERKIGSLNLNGRIGEKYTGNIFFSNYDIGQAAGTVALDTLIQISQTVKSWGMMHNLMLANTSWIHNIMLNYNNQTLTDRNATTSAFSNYTTDTWLLSYYVTLVAIKLSLTANYTLTSFELPSQETKINGPSIGLTKNWFKNMLTVNLMYSSMAYTINKESGRTIDRITFSTSYRASPKHRFNLRFYINQSSHEAEGVESFREIKSDIVYAYTF